MKVKGYEEKLETPEKLEVSLDKGMLIVKGERGEIKRRFVHPKISISLEDKSLMFRTKLLTKREKKQIGTFRAHIKNMFRGVTSGYVYKLKICSGHFPMNVAVKGNEFVIKNFIGEKVPRKIKLAEGVSVKVDGDHVQVESNDIELAGQTAASIERLSFRPGFDRRIFQQGIFIVEKPKKVQL